MPAPMHCRPRCRLARAGVAALLAAATIAPAAAQLRATANGPATLAPVPTFASTQTPSPQSPQSPQTLQSPTQQSTKPALPQTPPWLSDDYSLRPAATTAAQTTPAATGFPASTAPPAARSPIVPTQFAAEAPTSSIPADAATDDGSRTPIQRRTSPSPAGITAPPSLGGTVWGAVGCLAFVGLLLVGAARTVRKKFPASLGVLPREACEVLGRRRLDARTQLAFVRLNQRLLVLGTGPDGVRTLAELTDPQEIDQLTGLCRLNTLGRIAPANADRGSRFASLFRKQFPTTRAVAPSQSPASADELADLNRDNFATPAAAEPGHFPTGPATRPPSTRLDVMTP